MKDTKSKLDINLMPKVIKAVISNQKTTRCLGIIKKSILRTFRGNLIEFQVKR